MSFHFSYQKVRCDNFEFSRFFPWILISKRGLKMNLRIVTKNHAADSEIRFLTKSIRKPYSGKIFPSCKTRISLVLSHKAIYYDWNPISPRFPFEAKITVKHARKSSCLTFCSKLKFQQKIRTSEMTRVKKKKAKF